MYRLPVLTQQHHFRWQVSPCPIPAALTWGFPPHKVPWSPFPKHSTQLLILKGLVFSSVGIFDFCFNIEKLLSRRQNPEDNWESLRVHF